MSTKAAKLPQGGEGDGERVGSDPGPVREQLERILASREFSEAGRMVRFLRFVVEEKLKGESARLKEAVIGVSVFDRLPDYDPRLDPIVRVEARRLRSKLGKYYAGGGAADEVVIELPTGTYVPVIQFRGKAAPVKRERARIAVLPFANRSGNANEDYFSDGLTEELIHALTKIEGLQVVAWTSAVQLRGHERQVTDIRERLDVGYALRGSVRKTADRVRITAQLIDTAAGTYLWSETYDRGTRDIFAIQEDIAAAIARALQLRLSGTRLVPSSERRVNSYNLYLKGRYQWNERTPEALRRSILQFEEATKVDPTFAAAFAGIADAYALLADYGMMETREAMPLASAAARRALEVDPDCAEALTSLAFIQTLYEWKWAESEELYRRAIELKPGYVTAHHWYGLDYLAMLGRFQEAEVELAIALDLDPLSSIIREGRAFLNTIQGHFGLAVAEFEELMADDPSFFKAYTSMGRALIQLGDYERAIKMLGKGRHLAGDLPSVIGALGQAYALAGKPEEARKMMSELERLRAQRNVPAACYAVVHMGLREFDAALERLEAGAERRELPLSGLGVHPLWDPLRGLPRFQALLRKLGLPALP